MAFWLGAFSKIQIMFTIPPTYIKGAFFGKVRGQIQIFKVYLHSSLSFNSRGSNQNLSQSAKKYYLISPNSRRKLKNQTGEAKFSLLNSLDSRQIRRINCNFF